MAVLTMRDGVTHQLVPLIILLCPDEHFAILTSTGNGVHWHAQIWSPSNIPHPVCMPFQQLPLLRPLPLSFIKVPYL